MKGLGAFIKKELRENLANHRLLILAAVFLIFGMTNAPLAKYMPQLLATLADGFTLNVTPTALDAWVQFFKNAGGVGMSAVIILFGSMLSGEYNRGTLVLLVTKGLSRASVVLAKYLVAAFIMSFCYWLGFLATAGYTAYYWPGSALTHTFLAAAGLWSAGFLYLAILMLGAVLFRQAFTTILFTGGTIALLSLANMAPALAPWNPLALTSGTAIIEGTVRVGDLAAPLATTLALTVLALSAAVKLLARKRL